jgi:hypothetical protein
MQTAGILTRTIALPVSTARPFRLFRTLPSLIHLHSFLSHNRVDPAQEIARLRHSINQLESFIFSASNPGPSTPTRRSFVDPSDSIIKVEHTDGPVDCESNAAPGMLDRSAQGGLYAGPTSAATHLLPVSSPRYSSPSYVFIFTTFRQEGERQDSPESSEIPTSSAADASVEYDRDLLAMLPSIEIIDELAAYYFEYCNWVYRHVNQDAFNHNWDRFKAGKTADRIVLATVSTILAVATYYLPAQHQLFRIYPESHEELGRKFLNVSTVALRRRQQDGLKAYNLDLVEVLLVRCHYLTLLKRDSEEIWSSTGEVIRIGIAMGLHRDPGKWRMHRDVAERRRWAWWHIVLLERYFISALDLRITALTCDYW